jgi:hypothetical protein
VAHRTSPVKTSLYSSHLGGLGKGALVAMTEELGRLRVGRRRVLAAAAGAIATLAGAAVAKPSTAHAADGDPLVLGTVNDAVSQTVLNGELRIDNPGRSALVANGAAGVIASGTMGAAVFAWNESRLAISADTETGRALAAVARQPSGRALEAIGRSIFSRSGNATITFPKKSVVVAVPGGLPTGGLGYPAPPPVALATLQTNVAGVQVTPAVPNLATGSVTISLNKAPGTSSAPKSVEVGWFVVN